MIHEVAIAGLRGIEEGRLSDLSPLVILVGPNGGGKSTVLDALLIGSGSDPGDDVGRVVQRRPDLWNGSRWLVPKSAQNGSVIEVARQRGGQNERRSTKLAFKDAIDLDLAKDLMTQRPSVPISGSIMVDVESTTGNHVALVSFLADNSYQCKFSEERVPRWDTKLIDTPHRNNQQLDALCVAATERGRLDQAVAVLRSIFGDRVREVSILTDKAAPVVYAVFDHGNVPVLALGDGVPCLVRIALELAITPHGTILIEEPEIHQSPRMMTQMAQRIWAAVDRGVQVIAGTQSIALVEALRAHAPAWAQNDLSILSVQLEKGKLTSERIATRDPDVMRAALDKAFG
jgi:hypothetical protein